MNDTVAAVDLGSNSFHMIVARLSPSGDLQVIDRIRESVRLAEGLETNKTLNPDAITRALECLERFGQRLSPLPPECVRVVGTNTLRRARDAKSFLEKIETALGHNVDVISGAEEGRLIYAGVAPDIYPRHKKSLVVDIGGGSTEIIAGEALNPMRIESFGMGCVSHTQRFFPDGVINSKHWKTAVTEASRQLEPYIKAYRKQGWDIALGTSGTARAAYFIIQSQGWSKGSITAKNLKQLKKSFFQAGHVENLTLEGLSPRRQGVIVGGIAILTAVFDCLKLDSMEVSDRALRDGLLYDLVGRLHDKDVRARSVAAMAARYDVDIHHADAIANTGCLLLEQTGKDWNLPRHSSRQLLQWSAYLHEIGLAITHSKYNRHSAYLVQNTDLEGFSQNQQRLLAAMVYMHRGKIERTILDALPARDVETATRLTVLLRIAVLLHRSRDVEQSPDLQASAKKKQLTLTLPKAWLLDHPLTQADLQAERLYLETADIRLVIKKA